MHLRRTESECATVEFIQTVQRSDRAGAGVYSSLFLQFALAQSPVQTLKVCHMNSGTPCNSSM